MSSLYWIVSLYAILICQVTCKNSMTVCDEEFCKCDGFSRLICKCFGHHQELTIRGEGSYKVFDYVTEIQISNCQFVHFSANSIKSLQELKAIRLTNISDLVLTENSLWWPNNAAGEDFGIKIHIVNTTIKEIPSYSIKGNIHEIIIHSSNIQSIKPFSFSNLAHTKRIEIIDSVLKNVESQAFKKFSLESLNMKNVIVDILPSRTFSELIVEKHVKIHNVTIDLIKSSAFIISGPRKFSVEYCNIRNILGEAFRVETEGTVKFSYNNITSIDKGALLGFTTSPTVVRIAGLQEFNFENNSVMHFETNSLLTDGNSFEVSVKNFMVNRACDCNDSTWPTYFKAFENNLMCVNENIFENSETYKLTRCTLSPINLTMVISLTISIIFFILAMIIFTVWLAKRRKWSYVAWFNRKFSTDKNTGMVMPDGRTYKETELHVIVEQAQMLTTDL